MFTKRRGSVTEIPPEVEKKMRNLRKKKGQRKNKKKDEGRNVLVEI